MEPRAAAAAMFQPYLGEFEVSPLYCFFPPFQFGAMAPVVSGGIVCLRAGVVMAAGVHAGCLCMMLHTQTGNGKCALEVFSTAGL